MRYEKHDVRLKWGLLQNLKAGDIAIIRKEDEILGFGRIGIIAKGSAIKAHRRCPSCHSTDIRERKTKTPKWKCGHCAIEFFNPDTTESAVVSYAANIEGFVRFGNPPSVQAVKSCAAKGDGPGSQLSMMQLDFKKVRTLLEGTNIQLSPRSKPNGTGQGLGLSVEERTCIELHAMGTARRLYENAGWSLVDTSASQSYDLRATRNAERRFIEVKGTTGEGASVILTSGEVVHAKENPGECALVVVSEIRLEKSADGFHASGGKISTHIDPWCPEESRLEATQYRYHIKSN